MFAPAEASACFQNFMPTFQFCSVLLYIHIGIWHRSYQEKNTNRNHTQGNRTRSRALPDRRERPCQPPSLVYGPGTMPTHAQALPGYNWL